MKAPYCLQHAGNLWTLEPRPGDLDPVTGRWRKSCFKWQGYCDGTPCGVFKTKFDFEQFVSGQRYDEPRGPYAAAVSRAESWANYEARKALAAFYPDGTLPR